MPANPELKQKITNILQASFTGAAVSVSDGYADNIHVIVVSDRFEGLSEHEKQQTLWSAIDGSTLSEQEKAQISLILPYSPNELKELR